MSLLPPVRWFTEIGRADTAAVGGKGASLGELLSAGARVPPGFVVCTPAYQDFMTAADPGGVLRAQIGALDPADLGGLRQLAAAVRGRVEACALPAELQAELTRAYQQLCLGDERLPVAVRSSATAEDSAAASFAGLQDTYLWVRGSEDLLRHVRSCWASLFNDESISYRRERGLPEQGLGMAVVVQQMVDAACAGVMFSRSPTTGDRSVVTVEGSWGLGSCIVSGEVTPDRFVINKVTGEIVQRAIASKALQHRPSAQGSGIEAQEVPPAQRDLPCLDDRQLAELVRLARACETHFGCAQDMEWAVAAGAGGDVIYLLQSRPETVWSRREAAAVSRPRAKAFEHVFAVLGGKRKP